MNELDFLKALNDVDDDLILDAKKPIRAKNRIPSLLGKIGVAAAILCLLSVTVMAVSFSVRIIGSDQRVPIHEGYYMGIFTPSSKVTTVDYALETQKIKIPAQWSEALTEEWKNFGYDYKYFNGIDLREEDGSRIDFGGISLLEELLELRFVSSPELDRAVRSSYVSLVITDRERASLELREEGRISPDGLRIYLPFRIDGQGSPNPDVVEYCGLNIFIPLTDSFAEEYRSHVVLSGDGNQDLKERKALSQGKVESVILANTQSQDEPMKAFAAWEHEGIGYLLEMKTYYCVTADPAEIIMPYLANLED